ncbi:uncharacterized protein PHACADRAFT_201632 [Phanerochaete carnosa HHB-10118-sp]|uniref:Uncharacterized protein n=1 Tax=Phanerochaete carnosa (strain HHB-10118-sp) TaxID=650164 RepID=K5WGR5_PHACS|nr:uncharacterized protein PHACADRAFT_201632 [Phanerochaete carnosa HHB-10118-sp]EKM49377.1 hypothetical protein PHACADRAFT_201632 [Phanerochaete carnosa HHB-10118-sp]
MSSTCATIFECVPVSTLAESTSQIHIQSPSSTNLPNVEYTYDTDVSDNNSYYAPEIAQSRALTPVSHENTISVDKNSESHWDWSNASAEEIERKYQETTYLQRITEIRNNYSTIKLLMQLAQEQDNATKIFARTVTSFHALNENFTDTHRNAADLDQPSSSQNSASPPSYESDSHLSTKKLVRFISNNKSLDTIDSGWMSPSALSDWTTPAKVSRRQLKRERHRHNKQSKPLIVIKKALEEAVAEVQEEIWALN